MGKEGSFSGDEKAGIEDMCSAEFKNLCKNTPTPHQCTYIFFHKENFNFTLITSCEVDTCTFKVHDFNLT
jgi:hypothetical protein